MDPDYLAEEESGDSDEFTFEPVTKKSRLQQQQRRQSQIVVQPQAVRPVTRSIGRPPQAPPTQARRAPPLNLVGFLK